MSKGFVFLFMIFLHIVDDFCLQGKLADLKQKSWWKENYPDRKYRDDFIMALFIHAFSWCFMIHIPIFMYYGFNVPPIIYLEFALNIIVHAFIDHAKANMRVIALTDDQLFHIIQIVMAFGIAFYI